MDSLQRLIRNIVVVSLLLSVPVFGGLVVLGKRLLSFWGPTFVQSYTALVVLGLNTLVIAVVGTLVGTIMSMTGKQREAAWMIGGSAVFNLAFSLVLTPRFGLVGAAGATLAATVLRSALLAWYVRRYLGLSALPFAAQAP
jgi:O-antigen/teichoic acid export membrane protein